MCVFLGADTDVLLNKVFMGPVGNITRLHFDAHHAHGWLAQVKGSKLFILYPPSDTDLLQPLEGEATTQSPIDPLAPDLEIFPNYEKCHQYVTRSPSLSFSSSQSLSHSLNHDRIIPRKAQILAE